MALIVVMFMGRTYDTPYRLNSSLIFTVHAIYKYGRTPHTTTYQASVWTPPGLVR